MGITGGIDTEERSRSTATTLKKESPSSHSMKTAIVLASIALLAGIANHGCESAPADPKPKVNRALKVKDRQYLKEVAHDLDDWIKQANRTMEQRMKYLEDWASDAGWELYDIHDSLKSVGSQFYELYDDFWDFENNNNWNALRKKLNEAGFSSWEECEDVMIGSVVVGEDCETVITVNDYYDY